MKRILWLIVFIFALLSEIAVFFHTADLGFNLSLINPNILIAFPLFILEIGPAIFLAVWGFDTAKKNRKDEQLHTANGSSFTAFLINIGIIVSPWIWFGLFSFILTFIR